MPTTVVLTFSQALDPSAAEDVHDYRIVSPDGRHVKVRRAVYDAADHSVTLHLAERLSVHHPYYLTVVGTGSQGISNPQRELLDSQQAGQPGRDDHIKLTWRQLVLGHVSREFFTRYHIGPKDPESAGRSRDARPKTHAQGSGGPIREALREGDLVPGPPLERPGSMSTHGVLSGGAATFLDPRTFPGGPPRPTRPRRSLPPDRASAVAPVRGPRAPVRSRPDRSLGRGPPLTGRGAASGTGPVPSRAVRRGVGALCTARVEPSRRLNISSHESSMDRSGHILAPWHHGG